MSIKIMTFCDICNPDCVIGMDRRDKVRADSRGRRGGDAASWIEGDEDDILEKGWIVTSRHKHVCPRCYSQHKDHVFTI